ncbi:Phosphatidylserine decarboxylase proenzyme [compost metagenome]
MINLFAPGKVNLVESLKSLSVTKIGQPLAISTETFVTPDAEPAPLAELAEEEINAEHDASPLVDDSKDPV